MWDVIPERYQPCSCCGLKSNEVASLEDEVEAQELGRGSLAAGEPRLRILRIEVLEVREAHLRYSRETMSSKRVLHTTVDEWHPEP